MPPSPQSEDPSPGPGKAGPITRFLWSCAGADARLLGRCPHSDGVKYQGIGGIVLATAVLAFASGAYAFYTVFSPKDETALNRTLHLPTVAIALLGGAVWALVIFNIDRFIVSSTGKGDGTDAITLGELGKSLPRIIMAVIIGVCISAPLEIRILQSEIEAQLELEQNEYLARLNQQAEEMIDARKGELKAKLGAAEKRLDERAAYFEKRRMEIKEQRRQLEVEAEGLSPSRSPGRGPAWRDKKETLDKMEQELERDRQRDGERNRPLEADLAAWKTEQADLDARLAARRTSNVKQARHLDGLMKRIRISHAIGGQVPLWIALLLLAIETAPIFFKMMLIKGAYDYLDENQRRVASARAGVATEARVFTDGQNREVRVDVFHQAEAALVEERRRLESEAALSQVVHQEFRRRTEEDIRRDPAKYVSSAPSETPSTDPPDVAPGTTAGSSG